jgi:hypothetical protein
MPQNSKISPEKSGTALALGFSRLEIQFWDMLSRATSAAFTTLKQREDPLNGQAASWAASLRSKGFARKKPAEL